MVGKTVYIISINSEDQLQVDKTEIMRESKTHIHFGPSTWYCHFGNIRKKYLDSGTIQEKYTEAYLFTTTVNDDKFNYKKILLDAKIGMLRRNKKAKEYKKQRLHEEIGHLEDEIKHYKILNDGQLNLWPQEQRVDTKQEE